MRNGELKPTKVGKKTAATNDNITVTTTTYYRANTLLRDKNSKTFRGLPRTFVNLYPNQLRLMCNETVRHNKCRNY